MRCANPICGVESLYFRSGSLHCVDCCANPICGFNFRSGSLRCIDCREGVRGKEVEAQRKLVWLCRECSKLWSVETWRPPGQQLRRRQLLPGDAAGYAPSTLVENTAG